MKPVLGLIVITLLFASCNQAPVDTGKLISDIDSTMNSKVTPVSEKAAKLEATVDAQSKEIAALSAQVSELKKTLGGLELKPKVGKLGIYTQALTVADNSSFIQNALSGLVSVDGGMPVIQKYILENMSTYVGAYGCERMIDGFKGHPSLEKNLREIMAADVSKVAGGEKLRYFQRCQAMAKNAIFEIKPEEFVDEYVKSAKKRIVDANFDPNDMDDIYKNLYISLEYRDTITKREYVGLLIKMYAKAWSSSETRPGHKLLCKITGQTLGTDSSSTAETKKTAKLYQDWFDKNKSKLKE